MGDKKDQHVIIQLNCTDLPGVEFEGRTKVRLGIQRGQEVIEDVLANARSVTFNCDMRVEKNAKTGKPNFLGPYAHGTPEERFIYLSWGEKRGEKRGEKGGEKEGQHWHMFRRAKVHLKHLDWKTVEKALSTGQPIEAVIKMTDKKGGPLCASVKDEYIKWQV
jgi:hypothetical protein